MTVNTADILFVPLNTNHVGIFACVSEHLMGRFVFLCHDRICEEGQYHTENSLKSLSLPYIHFPGSINLKEGSLPARVEKFITMKRIIREVFLNVRPGCVVLAMDNDQVAKAFIDEARKSGITSFMIQEGLIRPHEYTEHRTYMSDNLQLLLKPFGIYTKYIKYGTGEADTYLVSGKRARNIFSKRGIPESRMVMVGQPKYDHILSGKRGMNTSSIKAKNAVLFAAPTDILTNAAVLDFTRKFSQTASKLELPVTIKLHPRSPSLPEEVRKAIASDLSTLKIIKEGDDTFDLLMEHGILLTISSTVVLEALLLGKECITADYLAGEFKLSYEAYDAVHPIANEDDIEGALFDAVNNRKKPENKMNLLLDELYELDGKAGQRAAKLIEDSLK